MSLVAVIESKEQRVNFPVIEVDVGYLVEVSMLRCSWRGSASLFEDEWHARSLDGMHASLNAVVTALLQQ